MDQKTRNDLRSVVTQCHRLLEEAVAQVLQGQFGIYAAEADAVQVEPASKMTHLSGEDWAYRTEILDHFEHLKALGPKPADSLARLVREVAFTHLNRLCAYKMMEARGLIRESVSKGLKSQGFLFYLADHEEDERRHAAGQQEVAYRHFLNWLGGTLSDEIGVLFSPTDPANRLYPPQRVIDEVLGKLNGEELAGIWAQDEAIGWVYQYFTPKEQRDAARDKKKGGSPTPRNSYELAFRNQFFTPRYVVEFLTDNTLGRIWYEMRQGNTTLADRCRYLVRRPDEVFFARAASADDEHPQAGVVEAARLLREGDEGSFPPFDPSDGAAQRMIDMAHTVSAYDRHGDEAFRIWNWEDGPRHAERAGELPTQYILDWLFMSCRADRHGGTGEVYAKPWFLSLANEVRRRAVAARNPDLTAEERLRLPVFVPYRAKKDPRELKILDPAVGSAHFLLYCFDLLLVIYEEAYADPDLGPALQRDYPTLAELRAAAPGLILKHNLHGIDIDPRAVQIAALALWLRCQRAFQEMGLRKDRPRIAKSNIVCAEPMPGEQQMLKEFVGQLEPKLLGQLVEVVFDKMKLAGEAGSLLKVEDEIRGAVAEARRQYAVGGLSVQPSFPGWAKEGEPTGGRRFAVKSLPDDQFFEQAEAKVVEALGRFAEQAQSGERLRRRLFTDDAAQGFAFIEMCHRRFDVVLMNPPFGLCQKHLNKYIHRNYPDTYVDLLGCFVTRGFQLAPAGLVGAITSRSFLVVKKLARWRCNEVVPSIRLLLDLGGSVMDDAFVESCAYVLDHRPSPYINVIDRRSVELHEREMHTSHGSSGILYFISRDRIARLPEYKLLYSLPNTLVSLLQNPGQVFEPEIGTAREGMRSFDNFRFLRLRWEVDPETISPHGIWEPLAKGGPYAVYYADIHLLVKWNQNGDELAEENRRVNGQTAQSRQASSYYRRPGGTYSKRSAKGFGVRALPAGCIIGDKGPAILSESDITPEYLVGWANSRLIVYLIHLQTNASNFHTGPIKKMAWHVPANADALATATKQTINALQQIAAHEEISTCYIGPPIADSIRSSFKLLLHRASLANNDREECRNRWDTAIDLAYGVDSSKLEAPADDDDETAEEDEDHDDSSPSDLTNFADGVLSFVVGVLFGRWNCPAVLNNQTASLLPDPFSALPQCPPAMLTGQDGLPASSAPTDYLPSVNWRGIAPDDPDHPDDILRRVRIGLEAVWNDRAEAVENEACEILGVKELRAYFRRPGKGGFWDAHIARYSRSRRKAPIYWLLQSADKNYALWLYYPRMNKETLFNALQQYVEPKLRLEGSRLDGLRQQQVAGDTGRATKALAKSIQKQEDLLSELQEFEGRLRKVANLHLEPDLNDGVVLNIAPLHELVPWKDAKAYWDELLAGDYAWSSVGKQLRERGLVT